MKYDYFYNNTWIQRLGEDDALTEMAQGQEAEDEE